MKNIYYILLLFSVFVFGQQKRVQTAIDTTKNKIGAEFKLTIKTTIDTASRVVFPKLKNIGALEVIQSYPIDTVKKDDRYELIKKYGLTQFDSGRYTIPSIKILINKQPFLTDSISIEVANVPIDTLKQKMFDIKNIIVVESPMGNWWKYLLGLIILGGLGAGGFWFYKKYKNKKEETLVHKTPIEKATFLMNSLEEKELWQKGEIKEYYSELTDIARNYIEEAIEIPAKESTTAELIEALGIASIKKKMILSQEIIQNLERVLKQADLVKFAKSKPLEYEITEDRNKIQKVIVTLDKAIPVEVQENEEMLLNELQKQKQLQQKLEKQRKKRNNTIFASVVLGLATIFLFFVATKGFDYVIDTIFGNETKELVEGEWIKSEYGNPSVIIETPRVLKRVDLTKTLPKDGLALIKEMQSFAYGGLLENFYLMVSTIKYKQQTEIDLQKSLDVSIEIIKSQGAENMIVKQEEFDTAEGIKGIKGYGTFSRLDKEEHSSKRIYYEILLFAQNGGLQQILILHQEGDRYADQLVNRVINSVELKQQN